MNTDKISGGKGDKKNPTDFDKIQLKIGIAVEFEHTNDKNVALEIAMDHLSEDPEYYTKLIQSGIADEPQALKIAKKYGIIQNERKTVNEKKIREIIRSVIKEEFDADRKQAALREIALLEMLVNVLAASERKGRITGLDANKHISNAYSSIVDALEQAVKHYKDHNNGETPKYRQYMPTVKFR